MGQVDAWVVSPVHEEVTIHVFRDLEPVGFDVHLSEGVEVKGLELLETGLLIRSDLKCPAVVGVLETVNLGFFHVEKVVEVRVALPLEECRIENGVLPYVEKHLNHMAKNDLLFFLSRWWHVLCD